VPACFGALLCWARCRAAAAERAARRAEQAARPSEARTQAAGWLLAEAAAGAAGGLHSRAPRLLAALLAEDALPLAALRDAAGRVRARPSTRAGASPCRRCWRSAGDVVSSDKLGAAALHSPICGATGGRRGGAPVPAAEHALPPAALRVAPDGKPRMRRQGRCCARARPRAGPAAQAPALGREALRERVAAVAGAALERLLERGRRGGLAPLWSALLGEAGARLDRHDAAASAGGAPPGALSRCAWAARVHALHACAAGAHSGHRRA